MYDESMVTGATGKSNPYRKHETRELRRLQEKDYWMQITRAKLLADLVFVCALHARRADAGADHPRQRTTCSSSTAASARCRRSPGSCPGYSGSDAAWLGGRC
jgi:hypothetical protein